MAPLDESTLFILRERCYNKKIAVNPGKKQEES